MGFVSFGDKQRHLKKNIDTCAEREARQVERVNNRTLKAKEKKELKKKWIKRAEHLDDDMLHKVWYKEIDQTPDVGAIKGYFGGLNFDKDGNL